jgi:hypothetical protein
MPFLNRNQIDPALRKKYDTEYRNRLRQALADPTISAERRQAIRDQLAQVGKPRTYDPNSPPKPGAVPIDGVEVP